MSAKKTNEITKDKIVAFYTDYCLLNGHKPHSVYEFSKKNSFEESLFYQFYASFENLEAAYFEEMFTYTLELLHKNEDYHLYSSQEKLSSFYFTFFEMATANRSFVKYLLDNQNWKLNSIKKLSKLRKHFLEYASSILENPLHVDNTKVNEVQRKLISEAAWIQLMSIFHFWLTDESQNFEKTDVFIEKSVKAGFDLAYNLPTKSIIDFGKFLFKEKFQMN